MRFEHQGMSLWYGTPDAPAPGETIPSGAATITIGVQPADASNKVEVRYRVNNGPEQSVPAQWLRSDPAKKSQYFQARFGPLQVGDTVEYLAICACAGRMVPSPEDFQRSYSSFRVTATDLEVEGKRGMPLKATAKSAPSFEKPSVSHAPLTVRGQVRQPDGSPLRGGIVRAFEKLLQSEEPLGEARTDETGHYGITFATERFLNHDKSGPDFLVRVFNVEGRLLAASPILYHAKPEETLDIQIPPPDGKAPSEYERLAAALAPALQGMHPADLHTENVEFLANTTGQDPERVASFVLAARLGRETDLPAEAFFGFTRSHLPGSLPALAARSPQERQEILERAIRDNIIPASARAKLDPVADKLHDVAVKQITRPRDGKPSALGGLLSTVMIGRDKQEAFLTAYLQHEGPITSFWKAMRANPQFGDNLVDHLQDSIRMAMLTNNHLPLVRELQRLQQTGTFTSFRDLAGLTEEDWLGLINKQVDGRPISVSPNTPGANDGEKARNYARTISNMIQEAYPTAAIAGRIKRNPGGVLYKEHLVKFFDKNPDFEFGSANIDKYLTEKAVLDAGMNRNLLREDLSMMQRLFKIAPSVRNIETLASNGFDSASRIAQMSKPSFVQQYSAPLGGAANAARIYERAALSSSMAVTVFARYAATMNSLSLPVLTDQPSEVTEIPDWTTLFGSLDLCECEHCRSVYSPAAYLVDILAFLNKRPALTAGKTGLDVFLSRRPDIEYLKLSCENTNRPVPYVDLVNEVLEVAILKGSTSPRPAEFQTETKGTSAELSAHPQHIYSDVYNTALAGVVYPWHLPFHLWTEEARTYLDHLDVKRHQIMEACFTGAPEDRLKDVNIATEYLRLTTTEREIITGADPHNAWEFWGFANSSNWMATLNGVPEFQQRSGLTYKELLELLDTRFIDPNGNLRIESTDASCDREEMTIANLDEEALNRIHCFVRLQRKLGWTIRDLDRVIAVLRPIDRSGNPALSNQFLRQLSHLRRLQQELNAPLHVITSWWATTLDTHTYGTEGLSENLSPYDRIFLNKSVLDPAGSIFQLREPSGDELADATQKIASHVPEVIAALGISAEALSLIIASEFPSPTSESTATLDSVDLNLTNLTKLYRIVSFAKALKLSIRDFLTMRALTEIDPFDAAHTELTLEFMHKARKIPASGFTIIELDYVLRHVDRPGAGNVPSEKQVRLALGEIRDGLLKIRKEHMIAPDATGELTKKKLALILDSSVAEQTVSMLTGTAVYSGPLDSLPAITFPELMAEKIKYDEAAKELQFTGAMTQAEKATLLGLSGEGAYQAAVTALFTAPRNFLTQHLTFLDSAEAIPQLLDATLMKPEEKFNFILSALIPHLHTVLSEKFVKEKLAVALRLDGAITEQLLSNWVHSVADASQTAMQVFLALANLSDPPTRANAIAQFDTYVRMEKIARIILRFKLTLDEVAWAFTRGPSRGWLNLNELPITPQGAVATLFAAWERLRDYVELRDALPSMEPALFEIFESVIAFDSATGDPVSAGAALLAKLSELTGWNKVDLEFLVGSSRFKFVYPNAFMDERALVRLKATLDMLKRLGLPAQQVWDWINPNVSEANALSIKQAAKAKYDNEQWLEITKPLRNVLRDKQRLALVFFILANPELLKKLGLSVTNGLNANDLFGRFLLDVEMSPCMMTSRIVQATNAVQLFVQRILMNLEPEVSLTPEDAREWSWMKNYRVWEANRKVFISPENWIEPELRDDKTPLFKELESDLLQNDVTPDTAETAYLRYLEGLDTVARLEICGMYHQVETHDGTPQGNKIIDILHVFARTRGTPHLYFYRQRINASGCDDGMWTAWEKVEVDIEGDHLIPIVYNRRLYLFWPQFVEGADEPSPKTELEVDSKIKTGGEAPRRYYDIRLAWSEYRNKKWSPKRLSDLAIRYYPIGQRKASKENFFFKAAVEDRTGDLLIRGTEHFGGLGDQYAIPPAFRFSGSDGTVTQHGIWVSYIFGSWLSLPLNTHVAYQTYAEDLGDNPLTLPYKNPLEGQGTITPQPLPTVATLRLTPGQFNLAYLHQLARFDSSEPFFYQDNTRTFFVVPKGRTRPVYDWQSPWEIDNTYIEVADKWHTIWRGFVEVEKFPVGPLPDPLGPLINPVEVAIGESSFPVQAGTALAPHISMSGPRLSEMRMFERNIGEISGNPLGGTSMQAIHTAEMPMQGSRSIMMSMTPAALGSTEITEMAAFAGSEGSAIGATGLQAASGISGGVQSAYGTSGGIVGHPRLFEPHYRFEPFYHPFVKLFRRELNRFGIDGLLQRKLQVEPTAPEFLVAAYEKFNFKTVYDPYENVVDTPFPGEEVDFEYGRAYSLYNWELFFHALFLIANRLSQNQRFAEAQKWFHYIFDPTDRSSYPPPRKYWRTRPFFENTTDELIQDLLKLLSYDGTDPVLRAKKERFECQIDQWRKNPFNPHALARLRISAYQKAVVMKYIDNLIAWGDQLFRRDTIESINEATQLYILAAEILGKRPENIPPRGVTAAKSFHDLKPDLDKFSNALIEIENRLPAPSISPSASTPDMVPSPAAILGQTLYFCIPRNEKLLRYWDLVEDRLFKIRHCMNIEGVVRQLPLFAPPIEPGLLVRAAAAGVSIDVALNAMSSASLPHYRFSTMIQKATELCAELKSLGAALLSALEKRDAEELSRLRSSHEIRLLNASRQVREQQIKEARAQAEALRKGRKVTEARQTYYSTRPYMNPKEKEHLAKLEAAFIFQTIGQALDIAAGAAALIPQFKIGVHGAFGSPAVDAEFGGHEISGALQFYSRAMSLLAAIHTHQGTMASIIGGYDRRKDDWEHQAELATKELPQIDQQIIAADIRVAIAEHELRNHDLQIENAKADDEFMRNKFTNRELYDWMVAQISAVYFQSYQLAYDIAKRAERAFRYELGDSTATFIDFGYWDSLKKGLLAGEKLHYDLKRMDLAYLDQNKREYEITRHISLTLLDPIALVKLKAAGDCFIELTETLFDVDYPGHYMRRLKSVSLSIPCVVGPYTGINCTLTLLRNSVRKSPVATSGYARTGSEDSRFEDNVGAIQSIVTSTAQNDAGMFEVNFRDERYLPFEGAGAISRWRLQLPQDSNHFDFDTISDVILHVRYTAREGGETLRNQVTNEVIKTLPKVGVRLFSARHDFPSEWHRFLHPTDTATSQTLEFELTPERFPFQFRGKNIQISKAQLVLRLKEDATYNTPLVLSLKPPGETEAAEAVTLNKNALLGYWPHAKLPQTEEVYSSPKGLGIWTLSGEKAAVAQAALEDILILCHYLVE